MSENINFDYVTEYIRKKLPVKNNYLSEIADEARKNKVPILQPESAQFISVLVKIHKPKKILEIGAAVGYSALLMKENWPCIEKIVTIERDSSMIHLAKENFERYDKDKVITLLTSDANEILSGIDEKFDLIFIDAAKGQYPKFLSSCKPLVAEGGIIVADNILFDGMVSGAPLNYKRNKTIVSRLQMFLDDISSDTDYETSIIPIGDGISLSVKKQQ